MNCLLDHVDSEIDLVLGDVALVSLSLLGTQQSQCLRQVQIRSVVLDSSENQSDSHTDNQNIDLRKRDRMKGKSVSTDQDSNQRSLLQFLFLLIVQQKQKVKKNLIV